MSRQVVGSLDFLTFWKDSFFSFPFDPGLHSKWIIDFCPWGFVLILSTFFGGIWLGFERFLRSGSLPTGEPAVKLVDHLGCLGMCCHKVHALIRQNEWQDSHVFPSGQAWGRPLQLSQMNNPPGQTLPSRRIQEQKYKGLLCSPHFEEIFFFFFCIICLVLEGRNSILLSFYECNSWISSQIITIKSSSNNQFRYKKMWMKKCPVLVPLWVSSPGVG